MMLQMVSQTESIIRWMITEGVKHLDLRGIIESCWQGFGGNDAGANGGDGK